MKTIPTYAINAFLEIIQAYGAFLKERSLVKKINKDQAIVNTLNEELKYNKKDYYSYEYREMGIVSGLSDSSIEDIETKVKQTKKTQEEDLTKNLIATEKHYKRLKHEFKKDFPELSCVLLDNLKDYQEYMENKKRSTHQKNKMIMEMSPSFISFFLYQFGGTEGSKIAYRDFACDINKKYNLTPSNIEELYNRMDLDSFNEIETLSVKEIESLFVILNKYIENIKEEDLIINKPNLSAEKNEIINKIVNEEYLRFKKIHTKYTQLMEN